LQKLKYSKAPSGISALSGAKSILLELSNHLSKKEHQITSGEYIEALHDYRVIVRKIRTLLTQLDGVLPEPGLSEFRQNFSVVMEKTSYLRDLEGSCSEFSRYKNSFDHDVGTELEPLQSFINKQERIERRKVLKYLRSAAYSRFRSDWLIYLQSTLTELKFDGHTLLKRARLPMQTIANEAVRKSYLKTVTLVRGRNKSMSSARFHRLRKSYKKLRYLLEIFTGIFPGKKHKQIVRELKMIQSKLGLLQDTEVLLDILKTSVPHIEGMLDKSNRKAIMKMTKYIKNKRKKARIDAAESIEEFTRFSTNIFQ